MRQAEICIAAAAGGKLRGERVVVVQKKFRAWFGGTLDIAAGSDWTDAGCRRMDCVVGIDPRGCSSSVHGGGERRLGERVEPFRVLKPLLGACRCVPSASATGKRMIGATVHARTRAVQQTRKTNQHKQKRRRKTVAVAVSD